MKLKVSERWRLVVFMLGVFVLTAGVAMASCEPGTCYVQDLHVRECRSVREALPDLQRSSKISPKALEVLRASEWSIVRAGATSSRAVPCSQTDPTMGPTPDGLRSARSVAALLTDAPCTEFKLGATVRRFRRTPCCEAGPNRTPECILPGDIVERVPEWLSNRGQRRALANAGR
jgi:hypothetical protein